MKKRIIFSFGIFLLFGMLLFALVSPSENSEELESLGKFGDVEAEGINVVSVPVVNGGARFGFEEGAVLRLGEQEFRDVSPRVRLDPSYIEVDAEGKITSARFIYQGGSETTYDFVGIGGKSTAFPVPPNSEVYFDGRSIRVIPRESSSSLGNIPNIVPDERGGVTPISYSGTEIKFSEDFYVSDGEVRFGRESISISVRDGQSNYYAISNGVHIQGDVANSVELCSTEDCYIGLRDTNKMFTSSQSFFAEAGEGKNFVVHLDESMLEINPRGRYLALRLENGGSVESVRDDTTRDNDFSLNLKGDVRLDNGQNLVRSDGDRLISSRRLLAAPVLDIPIIDRRVRAYNPHTDSFAYVTGNHFSEAGELRHSFKISPESIEINGIVETEPVKASDRVSLLRFGEGGRGDCEAILVGGRVRMVNCN